MSRSSRTPCLCTPSGFTALFTIVSVVVINVIAFAFALALTQKLRGTNLFRTVFFMPNLIGGIVLGYIWQLIFNGILVNYSTAPRSTRGSRGFCRPESSWLLGSRSAT